GHPSRPAPSSLSLHDALPIFDDEQSVALHPADGLAHGGAALPEALGDAGPQRDDAFLLELEDGPQVHLGGIDESAHALILPPRRSEEHTSELQSQSNLVCRLL